MRHVKQKRIKLSSVTHRCPLCELEMERVDPLEYLLRLVHAVAALLGQVAEAVPLVADLLAPEHDVEVDLRDHLKEG